MPLGWLADLPVLDRSRPGAGLDAGALRSGAQRLSSCLLECARRRPFVLFADRAALVEPLARTVWHRLSLLARRGVAGSAGLLLLEGSQLKKSFKGLDDSDRLS